MLTGMLSLLAGMACVLFLPVLPPPAIVALLVLATMWLALRLRTRWRWAPLLFALGASHGVLYGHWLLAGLLPARAEAQTVLLRGEVVDLPQRSSLGYQDVVKFTLAVEAADWRGETLPLRKVLISWYGSKVPVAAGQRWQLPVLLKRPRGMVNPGAFDYETWLISQRIGATGHVVDARLAKALPDARFSLARLRERAALTLDDWLEGHSQRGLFKALLIADKRELSAPLQQLFVETGLIHLLVISGSHITLLAAIGYGLGRLLSAAGAGSAWPAVGALASAFLYSAAAGFPLPTTRALVMVSVLVLALQRARALAVTHSLLLAAVLIALIDPLCFLSWSFWLSFGAVSALLLAGSGHLGRARRWRLWLAPQLAVFVLLLPAVAAMSGLLSLLSPLCNLVGIPLFTAVLVPGGLLASALSLLDPGLGGWLWALLDSLVDHFVRALAVVRDALAAGLLPVPGPSPLALLVASVAAMLLLAPLPRVWRAAAAGLLLLALSDRRALLPAQSLQLTVLDVGQGLAVVADTRNHRLVYDTGPALGDRFSAAEAAVLPFLRLRGRAPDRLLISHGDNDHAGGLEVLRSRYPAASVLANMGERASPSQPCVAGEVWEWDGVRFEVLHPASAAGDAGHNNQSCVLRIEGPGWSVLLPGDIEVEAERDLIEHAAKQLPAALLVAPHHGSLSSSSWPFIKRVAASDVVFSTGYRNRFNHPHPVVVARYLALSTRLHDTSEAGAIQFTFGTDGEMTWEYSRPLRRGYWLQ